MQGMAEKDRSVCSGSLFALWFPELCTSFHLFLIWLFLYSFLLCCSLSLLLRAECECERMSEDQVERVDCVGIAGSYR